MPDCYRRRLGLKDMLRFRKKSSELRTAFLNFTGRWRIGAERSWRSGVTAVETALVLPPFLLLCFGIIEVSLMHVAASNVEGQIAEAARLIKTGRIQGPAQKPAFKQAACASAFIDCEDLIVDVRSFPSFNAINFPNFVDDEGNAAGEQFNPGDGGDVVLVRAVYKYKISTPFLATILGDQGRDTKQLQAAALFRSEPF